MMSRGEAGTYRRARGALPTTMPGETTPPASSRSCPQHRRVRRTPTGTLAELPTTMLGTTLLSNADMRFEGVKGSISRSSHMPTRRATDLTYHMQPIACTRTLKHTNARYDDRTAMIQADSGQSHPISLMPHILVHTPADAWPLVSRHAHGKAALASTGHDASVSVSVSARTASPAPGGRLEDGLYQ